MSNPQNFVDIIYQSLSSMQQNSDNGDVINTYFRNNGINRETYWKPSHDFVEDEDNITIYIDVPGVKEENINIDFHNNRLKLSIKREKPYESEAIKNEIVYGEFNKQINLPISVTSKESVSLKFELGVLIITIDKNNENKNKFTLRLNESN